MNYIKKIREYYTPLELSNESLVVSLLNTTIEKNKLIDAILLDKKNDKYVKREFLYSKNNNPIFIIKSFFPLVYINKNVGTNNNLEKAIDEHFNASIIKIEYNLSWLNTEEKNLLNTSEEQGFIIKNYIYNEDQMLRYEEIIMLPNIITLVDEG